MPMTEKFWILYSWRRGTDSLVLWNQDGTLVGPSLALAPIRLRQVWLHWVLRLRCSFYLMGFLDRFHGCSFRLHLYIWSGVGRFRIGIHEDRFCSIICYVLGHI